MTLAQRRAALASAGILLVATAMSAGAVGAYAVPLWDVVRATAGLVGIETGVDPQHAAVLQAVRLPRVALGIVAGGALAVSGALMQGVLRNPLADPGLLGVSGGAAAAAAATLIFVPAASAFMLSALSAAGALLATLLVLALGREGGATLILAGVAVNALFGAGTGLLVLVASESQARSIAFWTLGSLGLGTWATVGVLAAITLALAPLIAWLARPLDALALGDVEARYLGVSVPNVRWAALACVGLLAGATTAICGVVGFVGLVVPHAVRLVLGPAHRFLLPAAAMLGGALVLGADVLARTAVAPAEIPLGTVTALLGTPVFVAILRRTLGAR